MQRPEATIHVASGLCIKLELGFGFILQNLPTTIKAIGADVVTQVCLASGRLHRNTRHVQRIV